MAAGAKAATRESGHGFALVLGTGFSPVRYAARLTGGCILWQVTRDNGEALSEPQVYQKRMVMMVEGGPIRPTSKGMILIIPVTFELGFSYI